MVLPLNQREAIALLQKIVLSMGGISLGEVLANLGLSSLKTALGISAPLTGGLSVMPYLSVAVTQGAIAGLTTQIIGKSTQTYLANGGSWGTLIRKSSLKTSLNLWIETLFCTDYARNSRPNYSPSRASQKITATMIVSIHNFLVKNDEPTSSPLLRRPG